MSRWIETVADVERFAEFIKKNGGRMTKFQRMSGFRGGFYFWIEIPKNSENGWAQKMLDEFRRRKL
jgi:hypothetical protein